MHIPDGYLSPSTCAALYAASAPFWYVALQRVKKAMHARAVPLLGLFAAFCFVIMMFNLPLPGGTTGHAVGMGMASIVLGPWVSMGAISIALLIQALFFGDGGITVFGANCFNMAIVGSLVAYATYRMISGRAAITSKRRVVAAALGGYFAINIAALCAAVEFGIQPIFFHDPSGVPLYAPYPLSVSIPAMMIGHLTFAGLAELVISAAIVGYLQKADPSMLQPTAPGAPSYEEPSSEPARSPVPPRKLWLALALALALTPLGILAVGSAWGEWSSHEFDSAATRQQIEAASGNHPAPSQSPEGLKHLSSLWRAPLPQYAPSFLRNVYFAYFASAAVGVGLILLITLLINRLPARRRAGTFVERTMKSLLNAAQETVFAEELARTDGLLQRQDARVKLVGLAALIVAAVTVRQLSVLAALFAISVILAALSRVPLRLLTKRVWLAVLAFTGVVALPSIFLVPGATVFRVPIVDWKVSRQGLTGAAFLVLRAETMATFAFLLVLLTPWNRILRVLRWFRIPASVVFILEMTYRYLFLLLQTAQDMMESRRARLVGRLLPSEQRRLAGAMAGVLLDKSLQLSGEVYQSMQARGFRGDIRLAVERNLKVRDWLHLTVFVSVAAVLIWMGR